MSTLVKNVKTHHWIPVLFLLQRFTKMNPIKLDLEYFQFMKNGQEPIFQTNLKPIFGKPQKKLVKY